jgi:ring-1,2-phenylacetyl-CoA epoxidase subunit PaaC
VGELFVPHPVEDRLTAAGARVDPAGLRVESDQVMARCWRLAGWLGRRYRPRPVSGRTGRDGVHTEAMGYLLAEMQSIARAHPGAT